jgi:hypothetical protein
METIKYSTDNTPMAVPAIAIVLFFPRRVTGFIKAAIPKNNATTPAAHPKKGIQKSVKKPISKRITAAMPKVIDQVADFDDTEVTELMSNLQQPQKLQQV